MTITIATRHCTIPDSLRAHAEERVERLTRYNSRLSAADLIFDEDHGAKAVEGRLVVDGAPLIIAHAEADTFRAAVDQVSGRLARQLKRQDGRRRARRRAATPAPEPEIDIEREPPAP